MNLIILVAVATVISSTNSAIIIGNGVYQSSNGGKLNIFTKEDGLHCGVIVCPVNSRCLITQKNAENDTKILITTTKCFDQELNLLNQNVTEEPTSEHNIVNTRIESGGGSTITYDPKLAAELEKEINENVRKTLEETLGSVQTNLNHALNTPFFQNGFGDSFPFGPRNSPFGPNFPFGNSNPFGPNFPFGGRPEVDVVIYPEFDERATAGPVGKDPNVSLNEDGKTNPDNKKPGNNDFNNVSATGTDMEVKKNDDIKPIDKKNTREDVESDEVNEVASHL